MVDVVGVLYPYELTCQFIQISEFFRCCGIYVYGTHMEYDGWEGKLEGAGIEWKICLVNGFGQLDMVRGSIGETHKKYIIAYGHELADEYFSPGEVIIEQDISSMIERIDAENNGDGFLRLFFEYYKSNELYRALFSIHNIDAAKTLLEDSVSQIDNALAWLKETESTSAAYYFVLAYISYSRYKAKKEDNLDCFKEVKQLINKIQELEEEYPGVDELEGDLYFHFGNNYIFGLLHYENCFNSYNYTAPYKLSRYWKDIVKSEKNELECLRRAYECNRESHNAAFALGRFYEDKSWTGKALEIYSDIVDSLKKKEENNWLTISEFSALCKAHKRIGCVIYKNEDDPRYFEAIEEYKIIFRLWNGCDENKFILCFPRMYRKEVIDSYKNSFNIDGVLFSLAKIYMLVSRDEKSEKALDMARRAYEGNVETIDTDWM